MTRTRALAAIALTLAQVAVAQDVRVNAAFDRRRVLPGEQMSYTITLSGDSLPGARALPQPDFSDFDVVGGPSTGQSSEIRFVNGSVSKRENLTFSWRLVAKKEGVAAVPAAVLVVGSQRMSIPRAEIQVDASAGQGAPPPQQQEPVNPFDPFGDRARADGRRAWNQPVQRRFGEGLVVRTIPSDTQVWQGQAVPMQDVLSLDQDVSSFGPKDAPEFPGFSKKQRDGLKVESHKVQDPQTGQIHSEATIAQWVIVPLSAGRKQLPGHSYKFYLPSMDPMERMFGRQYEVDKASQPYVIDVRPLPDGAPATFGGAVGSFQLDASLASTSLKAGDGTQLVIRIRGRGSFEGVTAPKLRLPAAVKTFEPEVSEHVDFTDDGRLEGSKTFTIPLLVSEPGKHEIPPIEWAFFDPATGRYVERRTEPLRLEAAPGEVTVAVAAPVVQASADVQVRGTDIRHVRGELPSWQPDLGASGPPRWLTMAALFGPILNVAVMLLGLAARLRHRDPLTRRAQEAVSVARARLRQATAAASAGKTLEAVDAAAKAVSGLVSDRLGLGVELSPVEAARAVGSAAGEDMAHRVERFLTGCDFARFAAAEAVDVAALLSEAEALVPVVGRIEAPAGEAS